MDPPEVPPRAMTMTEVPRTEAYSKYNDAPGTGRTGMYAIPPNNYDFYTEEEKCVPRRTKSPICEPTAPRPTPRRAARPAPRGALDASPSRKDLHEN